MQPPILVSGCARSGTSLVAQILHVCGAFKGETVAPDPLSNPDGFFENIYVREKVVKDILRANDCDPLGVKKLPKPGTLQYPSFKGMVMKQMEEEGYRDGPWLYKDAKLAYMPELWMREFPGAKWVLTKRNPNAIVTSCMRTHFMRQHSGDAKFWGKWVDETFKRLEAISVRHGAFVLDTDKLAKGDLSEVKECVDWLGLEWDEEKVRACIKPQHWHSKDINTSIPINTDLDKINENVKSACERDLRWLGMSPPNPQAQIAIVGGGPSLKWKWKEIRSLQSKGVYILALNGAYKFLLSKGVVADGMAMLDARKDINLDFVSKARIATTFFLSSQVDPAVFDRLVEKYSVVVWHNEVGNNVYEVVKGFGRETLIVPPLGTTIGIRALWLAYALGFRKIHVFGLDSMVRDGAHHAYEQKQNDGFPVQTMNVGGQQFPAEIWMVAQVQDFQMWANQFRDVAWQIHDCPPLEAMMEPRQETAA